MPFASLFDADPPQWQTLVIPAAGLVTALASLFFGRFVLSHRRSRARAAGPDADGPDADAPDHDPFDHGSVSERRTAARRKGNPIELLITEPDATGEPRRGWVIDRSVRGLCLLLNENVPPGTVLSIKPRSGPPETPWVQVEVRNCKKEHSGYEAGCQFVRSPPWAVLLLFG
jgi:hypothetical protein